MTINYKRIWISMCSFPSALNTKFLNKKRASVSDWCVWDILKSHYTYHFMEVTWKPTYKKKKTKNYATLYKDKTKLKIKYL